MNLPAHDLITVATYWDPMEAQIARLRLAHEEIPAFLEKEFMVLMAWHFTNAIGGIRLAVPATQYEDARSVLATKVSFADWRDTGCWELRVNGQAVLAREGANSAARQRRYDLPLSEREELAQRALRAALLGVAWMTPLLFACVHLARFRSLRGRCRVAYRRQAWVATWLAASMLLFLIAAIGWIIAQRYDFGYMIERRESISQPQFGSRP